MLDFSSTTSLYAAVNAGPFLLRFTAIVLLNTASQLALWTAPFLLEECVTFSCGTLVPTSQLRCPAFLLATHSGSAGLVRVLYSCWYFWCKSIDACVLIIQKHDFITFWKSESRFNISCLCQIFSWAPLTRRIQVNVSNAPLSQQVISGALIISAPWA